LTSTPYYTVDRCAIVQILPSKYFAKTTLLQADMGTINSDWLVGSWIDWLVGKVTSIDWLVASTKCSDILLVVCHIVLSGIGK
jgi:hypothetical protein